MTLDRSELALSRLQFRTKRVSGAVGCQYLQICSVLGVHPVRSPPPFLRNAGREWAGSGVASLRNLSDFWTIPQRNGPRVFAITDRYRAQGGELVVLNKTGQFRVLIDPAGGK